MREPIYAIPENAGRVGSTIPPGPVPVSGCVSVIPSVFPNVFPSIKRLTSPNEIYFDLLGTPRSGISTLLFTDSNLFGIDPEIWATLRSGFVLGTVGASQAVIWINKDNAASSYPERTSRVDYLSNQSAAKIVLGANDGGLQSSQLATIRRFKWVIGTVLTVSFGVSMTRVNDDNNQKNWGWFDEFNGYMFRMEGNSLNVVRRTFVTGQVVDIVVNQGQFNGDRLDGSGLSKWTIDTTLVTMFRIEINCTGTGARFFGFVPDIDPANKGQARWVLIHTFNQSDTSPMTAFSDISLPIGFEVKQLQGRVLSDQSITKYGASVQSEVANEGEFDNSTLRQISSLLAFPRNNTVGYLVDSTKDNILFSIKIAALIGTKINSRTTYGQFLTVFATASVVIKIYKNAVLGGLGYLPSPEPIGGLSGILTDVVQTQRVISGQLLAEFYVSKDKSHLINLDNIFSRLRQSLNYIYLLEVNPENNDVSIVTFRHDQLIVTAQATGPTAYHLFVEEPVEFTNRDNCSEDQPDGVFVYPAPVANHPQVFASLSFKEI